MPLSKARLTGPTLTKPTLTLELFVNKSYTEFYAIPSNGSVAETRYLTDGRRDGRGLDITLRLLRPT
jgi:hypothetical protein